MKIKEIFKKVLKKKDNEEFKKGCFIRFIDKTKPTHCGIYMFLGKCKYKDPQTREWINAMMYQNENGIFVREESDFISSFKRL